MLRAALFLSSGILLAAAGCSVIAGYSLGLVLRLGVPGLVMLFGLVLERWRYKSVTARRPGPDWVATDERFVDPESGKLVTVFYRPSTGERRYVAGPSKNSSTDRNEFSWHPNAS
jgi:hypothetical protein